MILLLLVPILLRSIYASLRPAFERYRLRPASQIDSDETLDNCDLPPANTGAVKKLDVHLHAVKQILLLT